MAFPIATATVEAHAAIQARVSEWWVTDCGKTAATLQWGNKAISPPANGLWARATMLPGENDLSIGVLDIKSGVLVIDIFGPRGTGTGAITALADKAKDKFQRQNAGGIQYLTVDGPRELPDNASARQALRIRYQYSEDIS